MEVAKTIVKYLIGGILVAAGTTVIGSAGK